MVSGRASRVGRAAPVEDTLAREDLLVFAVFLRRGEPAAEVRVLDFVDLAFVSRDMQSSDLVNGRIGAQIQMKVLQS